MVLKALVGLIALVGLFGWAATAAGHAGLESSVPAAGSTVASAPLTLELTFDEEVASDGVTVRVLGPDGDEVQAGTAEVDLNDPERRHVTLSLQGNLPPGRYTVEWEATSNLDDHADKGSFAFTVGAPSSPGASPASSTPAGTLGAVASSVQAEATLDANANGNPLASEEDDFDGRALALSIGAGLVGVLVIVLVWRAVRPRNPVFGSRARG